MRVEGLVRSWGVPLGSSEGRSPKQPNHTGGWDLRGEGFIRNVTLERCATSVVHHSKSLSVPDRPHITTCQRVAQGHQAGFQQSGVSGEGSWGIWISGRGDSPGPGEAVASPKTHRRGSRVQRHSRYMGSHARVLKTSKRKMIWGCESMLHTLQRGCTEVPRMYFSGKLTRFLAWLVHPSGHTYILDGWK